MKNKEILLPQGVRVGERPRGIEFLTRKANTYVPIIEQLKILPNTATIQMDITGADKKRINYIKVSLRTLAKKMAYGKKISFALQGNLLHVWSDHK